MLGNVYKVYKHIKFIVYKELFIWYYSYFKCQLCIYAQLIIIYTKKKQSQGNDS